jgi:serine/threonine protein kinase/CHASE3 domain sensor protein
MADDDSKIKNECTLARIITEKGVLSVKDAAAVTLQLVKAVADLHTQGKVHRGICADVVFLDSSMAAKLSPIEPMATLGGVDCDPATCPPQLQNVPPVSVPAEIEKAQQALTEAGVLLDPRKIDFYQLGALLCFMVSGHRVSDYLRSCKAKTAVPEIIRPIIDRALGLNAKDCFESAESFAKALEAVIAGKTAAAEGESAHLPDSIFVEPSSKPKDESPAPRDVSAVVEGELPFKKLGHYQIIERIGHGGMGDVYKGYEKALDRFVAIKVLPAELARQEDFVKRFHAEAAAIAKLDHPNIVRIYYTGEAGDHHFFAMQYVDGKTLADVLASRKKLSANEALPIVEQCLAGIGAAHKIGLVHRDVKPGNVLLDRHSRRALVTDFGVVKTVQAETHITATGVIMGTADYIAPEQARGQDIDCRADLYAMGVLIYQMLGGQLPFEAESATSMMFQHAYEPPPPLAEIAPDVPGPLADIVMKLMAKKPQDRYQSAEEVLADLHNICLMPEEASTKSRASMVTAPDFGSAPEIPGDLLRFAPTGKLRRLRNRIADFFGTHAPQVVERMQTTQQQVDSAVAEYERQREQLAKLAEEAKSLAADLHQQAQTHASTAQMAGRRAEAAANTIAKQRALKQQEEDEQAAAELAQLAAEQEQQADEISLRLAKLDAKLVELHSQRNALSARLKVAQAHQKLQTAPLSAWQRRRKLIYTAAAFILLGLVAVIAYFFVLQIRPQSKWVDLLEQIDVKRDTRGGQWRFENGVLVGFAQSTLETTYELPGEYDVLWEFESNSTAINLLLASPVEKRFEWMMKGWSHQLCAIRDVDCKPVNANETTTVYPMISGVRHVSELRVRNDKIVALINGEEILSYRTDWSNIEICEAWHPFELKPRTLGIWLNKHWTKTYRLKVKPHN